MTQPRPHPDVAAFERAYAERRGLTVEQLHTHGLYAEPCNCGLDGCDGYAVGLPWEEAIVEDRRRGSRGPSLAEFAATYLNTPIQPYQREAIAALTEGVTDLRIPIVFGRVEPGVIFYGLDTGDQPSVAVTITASRSGCSGSFERLDVLGLQAAARELELSLSPGVSYEIHHVNGDPTDNTLENLRLVPTARSNFNSATAAFRENPTAANAVAVQEAARVYLSTGTIVLPDDTPGLDDHLARPRTRLPADVEDSLSRELTDLARAGKEDEFRALASTCVAPGEVEELWAKLRRLIR